MLAHIYKETSILANTMRWPIAELTMGHRLRRWPNISPTLGQRLLFDGLEEGQNNYND